MFKKLQIRDWRQIGEINIDFAGVTILTGPNGTGKTTLLNLLSRHFGWNINFVSTPKRDEKKGIFRFLSGIRERLSSLDGVPQDVVTIGTIEYQDGTKTDLSLNREVKTQYQININSSRSLPGIYIPSHRFRHIYEPVKDIPIEPKSRAAHFKEYAGQVQGQFTSTQFGGRSPEYLIKSTLISLAVFGYGGKSVIPVEEYRKAFEGFEHALATILPESIGFQKIEIRVPEIVLITKSGEFSWDAVSGGLSSLISIVWPIFMYSLDAESFVIVIDEPENHLHPSMQRKLLPDLIKLFPKAQFVIATHSPFVVSSVRESKAYVLDYNSERCVTSTLLDFEDRSGNAVHVLREALGVPITLPIWVEDELKVISKKYQMRELSSELLAQIKADLSELNLGEYLPEAALEVVKSRQ